MWYYHMADRHCTPILHLILSQIETKCIQSINTPLRSETTKKCDPI